MSTNDVQIAWAEVAGRVANISEFRGTPRGSRPKAVCQLCRRRLTMKLGDERAHHYAHRPGDECSLQNPETALHYNTKHLLASKLRRVRLLGVTTKCAWSFKQARCTSDLSSVAAENWDDVHVESFISPIRPDILLATSGLPMLAIEIRATHAVPNAKAARLADINIPWIEVTAGQECDAWDPGDLLPVIRYESGSEPGFCDTHSKRPQIRYAAPAPERERERQPRASTTQVDPGHLGERWRFRVVDCYPARGYRVRKVFWVFRTESEPRSIRLRVAEFEDSDFPVVADFRTSIKSDEALREVDECLVRHLRRKFESYNAPQPWREAQEFPQNPATVYRGDFMSF